MRNGDGNKMSTNGKLMEYITYAQNLKIKLEGKNAEDIISDKWKNVLAILDKISTNTIK